jgi:hypothetical protein
MAEGTEVVSIGCDDVAEFIRLLPREMFFAP